MHMKVTKYFNSIEMGTVKNGYKRSKRRQVQTLRSESVLEENTIRYTTAHLNSASSILHGLYISNISMFPSFLNYVYYLAFNISIL